MTTTTYTRGAQYGADMLIESIQAYDENADYDTAVELVNNIADEVNSNLPGSYAWYPFTSEVYVAIDEEEKLTDELFDEIRTQAFEMVMSEREEV